MESIQSALRKELERLDQWMLSVEKEFESILQKVHVSQEKSARNLIHYLAMRCKDIRALQDNLHEQGLSSLTNAESHIRSQLLSVLHYLGNHGPQALVTYQTGKSLLKEKAKSLFGSCSETTVPCIMVSFDTTYADDFVTVKRLLQCGMNIARINCAHDHEQLWMKMIKNIRLATESTGLPCKIYMDLAGPKIRTCIHNEKKNRIPVKKNKRFYLVESPSYYNNVPEILINMNGIINQLRVDEKVLFDDGLIEAKVRSIRGNAAELEVTRVSAKKPFLKDEKGINFPESKIILPALTDYDKQCLPFIIDHADMVGFSFVSNTADLLELYDEMKDSELPVILKIETPEAVKNLPELLLKGMEKPDLGVMIARGDLAVEIGFERLSEIQEEILWICEAAHIPVVWATQVLESLNKSGVATRSEVTDAAHAIMAECVLINKGENTLQVIEALKDILTRSGGHHSKKRYTFRPLAIATRFIGNEQENLPLNI